MINIQLLREKSLGPPFLAVSMKDLKEVFSSLFFFFAVLGLEFRAYTVSHSASSFL
jgi:hypothetical protein